ncbi:MAG TPA: cation diffusion facilitator family transporter [Sphingomonadaceae bacterium]
MAGHESTRVILIALAANLGIAAAKFAAAAITGSSAMLTEGIHSTVDSANEVLLLYGTRQSERPPDRTHPFGYGRELYFWSFVVAILVFALGAGVSFYEGVRHLLHPEPPSDVLVAFAVLAISIVLESWSSLAALRRFNRERGAKGVYRAVRETKDAPNLVVLLENGGAVIGLLIAAAGVGLTALTGNPLFDGVASLLIALVLAAMAVILLVEAKGLLIGEAADPALVKALRSCIESHDGIVAVHEVLTIHQAPRMVVAVISADFEDTITARDVEQTIARIEREIAANHPQVTRIYIRPLDSAMRR